MSDSHGPENPVAPLGPEEYIEQAYFFALVAERIENTPAQEVLESAREEALATTRLPMAVDFLLAELRHAGLMSTAMRRLLHYFTPFQAFVTGEAEDERGRFDFRVGLEVLAREARYRSGEASRHTPTLQGLFLYQFESLCRNRLGYDAGLTAMAEDPAYPPEWSEWILAIRHQVGMVDIADLVYVNSVHAHQRGGGGGSAPLFGDREGRIALANRRKDPLFFFNSLQRQLGYPAAPRPRAVDPEQALLPQLARRIEQLEKRIQLLEEDQRGGFDLSQFYERPSNK